MEITSVFENEHGVDHLLDASSEEHEIMKMSDDIHGQIMSLVLSCSSINGQSIRTMNDPFN
jgi:hypothetical protein